MLEIHHGPLNVPLILKRWYEEESLKNYGAFIPFIGTVREENGIDGLSFDIYDPLLNRWFTEWQQRAKTEDALVKMAHSRGDVPVHASSYIAAVFSPKRRTALEMIETFVESFKASAPIWKYDLVNGQSIYAADRSAPIEGSGILV